MHLLETFAVGPFQCNCSILACADTKDAVVVDPGGDLPKIRAVLAHYDLTVKWILHTHAHLDHIYNTREVKEETGATIGLHRDDLFLYDAFALQAQMFGWQPRSVLPVDRYFEHGDKLAFGKRAVEVIHTPGHTPGSCCFQLDSAPLLLSGDTLFDGSVGRTDLPGGDFPTLERSIQQRLYTLDPDVKVIPGHGPTTTIGDELRSNPFVRATRA